MADEDQIVYWPGIGDDQTHGLESQFFERSPFFFEILDPVFLIDAAALEEAIEFDAA